MPHEYNRNLIPRAKEMRENMTPQEQHLWFGFLRGHPIRFKRQAVIYHYVADFYSHTARLIIEVDGKQHQQADAKEYDNLRTETLEQLDLQVLRFTNDEIDHHFSEVRQKINQAIQERI